MKEVNHLAQGIISPEGGNDASRYPFPDSHLPITLHVIPIYHIDFATLSLIRNRTAVCFAIIICVFNTSSHSFALSSLVFAAKSCLLDKSLP